MKDVNNDDELQLKSAPINTMLPTQETTTNRDSSVEIKNLTASLETMRTSVLQV